MTRSSRWTPLLLAAGLAFGGAAFAQAKKEVTFAHQDMLVPLRTVMESGELEKATGYKINWRMFGGGGDVIKAMASGDVQIGEAGSSPIVAAASQGQDVKLFWILDDIADAEALIVRNGSGINSIKDFKGKKVATPFVSTAHYQLMALMKVEGVDAKGVNVMNMRPPEIAAAWERGDIDAAFIWDPVLTKIKGNGKVIASSKTIGAKGFPTFDGLIVNAKWAAEHEAFMVALVKVLAKADETYRANKAKWTVDSRRGQGGRQVDQGRAQGRAGHDGALHLPDPGRATRSELAGRRRRQGDDQHRRVPEGAGPHPGGQARLQGVRDRRLRQEGDGQVGPQG
jgi:taurine transport system substrate-binding protein